jgi:hypothetical protein
MFSHHLPCLFFLSSRLTVTRRARPPAAAPRFLRPVHEGAVMGTYYAGQMLIALSVCGGAVTVATDFDLDDAGSAPV